MSFYESDWERLATRAIAFCSDLFRSGQIWESSFPFPESWESLLLEVIPVTEIPKGAWQQKTQ